MNSIPNKLYHITCKTNLKSIEQYGLGARVGRGIDLHQAKIGTIYFIDFNPKQFLSGQGYDLDDEQQDMILLLVGSILGESDFSSIAVIQVETKNIEKSNLKKDKEEYVWIYNGIIYNFKSSCYEIATKQRDDDFESIGQDLFTNTNTILCSDIDHPEMKNCGFDNGSSEDSSETESSSESSSESEYEPMDITNQEIELVNRILNANNVIFR
jgi:hypothetical protein